jgi:DNA-directed RNA polymerase subunit N (RpoN/RPB10)
MRPSESFERYRQRYAHEQARRALLAHRRLARYAERRGMLSQLVAVSVWMLERGGADAFARFERSLPDV